MVVPPMKIHIWEDAKPFAIHTPRLIRLAFQEEVKAELDSMVAQGIITPAGEDPSLWCHSLVAVAKPNGGVRITTDLTKLNSQVSRPAHISGCLVRLLADRLGRRGPTSHHFHNAIRTLSVLPRAHGFLRHRGCFLS